jgi:hypothetical protein
MPEVEPLDLVGRRSEKASSYSTLRPASAILGRTFRFHGNQLLYSVHFAVDEDDVRNLDRCPALAGRSRLEVTGTETQRRPEEIRAELLESQPVCVEALRSTADRRSPIARLG